MAGIDGKTKLQLMVAIPQLYYKAGQTDKADAAARKLIELRQGPERRQARQPSSRRPAIVIIGQFAEKAGDYGKAAENYIKAYGVFKDPSIVKQLNGLADNLYKAEQVRRGRTGLPAVLRRRPGPRERHAPRPDPLQAGQGRRGPGHLQGSLRQEEDRAAGPEHRHHPEQPGQDRPVQDDGGRQRQHRSRPSSIPAQQKNFLGQAQNLFVGQDKELASSYAKIEEHKKAIEEFTKTYNAKIEGKTEDDLSEADKRLLKTLEANIEAEKPGHRQDPGQPEGRPRQVQRPRRPGQDPARQVRRRPDRLATPAVRPSGRGRTTRSHR